MKSLNYFPFLILLILIIALQFSTLDVQATPSEFEQSISTIVTIGPSFTMSSDRNTEMGVGMDVNLLARYDFLRFLSAGLGVDYKMYRFEVNNMVPSITETYTIKLDKIAIPFFIVGHYSFYFLEETQASFLAPFSLFLQAGLGLNIIANAVYDTPQGQEYDINEPFDFIYASFDLSAGMEYNIILGEGEDALSLGFIQLFYHLSTSLGKVVSGGIIAPLRIESARLMDHNICVGYGYAWGL